MIPQNLNRIDEWNFKDILFCVDFDPVSSRVWMGSSDFGVYELDTTSKTPQRHAFEGEGHSSYVTCMARSHNTLITGSYDGRLIWWDLDSREEIRRVAAHDRWIRKLVVSPDQTRVISVGDDMQCRVWDATSGQAIAAFSDHPPQTPHHYPSMLYAVAVSPDGKRIATGDRVGHVAIWDANSFEKISTIETPTLYTWDPRARRHSTGGIRSLCFSPDSSRVAVGGVGKIGNIDHLDGPARLEVFNLSTGERLLELEDNKKKGLIEQIVWSHDGKAILTVGGDNNGFITIYDSESGQLLHQDGQNGHIHDISHDQHFENIYLAGHERITRWSTAPNK